MIPFPEFSEALRRNEVLDAADLRLVAWLRDHAAGEDADALASVAAALCRACTEGSLCLPMEEDGMGGALRDLCSAAGLPVDGAGQAVRRFLASAHAGRCDAVLGTPGNPRPLLRAHGMLYLHRYWYAENTVAQALLRHGGDPPDAPAGARLADILRETLKERPLRAGDGSPLVLAPKQREALETSLRSRVFVLSGGPGTGKTTWTAAWLRAVLRLPGVSPDRIRLCAPTGRAARRLEESLRATIAGTGDDPRDAAALGMPVTTLHRLLGWRAFEGRFARDADDPLDADWVLLDEASMADVFLLAALVRALAPGARLVLAGDPDQLPAVEAGSILGALLPEGRDGAGRGLVPAVTLDVSHRARGDVIPLAAAVRRGDGDAVLDLLGAPVDAATLFGTSNPVARSAPEGEADGGLKGVLTAYARAVFGDAEAGGSGYAEQLRRFRTLSRNDEPKALDSLWLQAGRARILAPLRRGPVSVERANRVLREVLEPEWRRHGDFPAGGTAEGGFHGAPVLIVRNDSRTGLSNGDLGLWLEAADGTAAFFPRPDLPEGWLRIPVALLPAWEPGFATTVHKSQGSECDEVLVLLPDADNRLLTRETLYTAVTRARKAVRVFGTDAAVREAVEKRMTRYVGLRRVMN